MTLHLVLEWRLIDGAEELCALLLIAGGCGVLTVFVLNKFFGIKVIDPLSIAAANIWLRCPRCSKEQEIVSGESRCVACKLRIKIEVEEPLCPKCGYNLHALTHPFCPECGTTLYGETIGNPALMKANPAILPPAPASVIDP
jgi:hypothetical protein